MKDIVYWVWLSLCCTPDTATFPRLLEHYSDAEEIYSLRERELASILTRPSADKTLLCNKDLSRAQRILEVCEEKGIQLIPFSDPRLPERLKDIPTPPVLLYCLGSFPRADEGLFVGIVGTRSLSDYGRKTAYKLSYDLSSAGATVISGMAAGIDGVAHAGALAAGKSTLAVLGTGIDSVYPALHETLRNAIIENGAVISEYPPGFKGTRISFPQRNRIISAFSQAVIVVEGSEKSGAVITARHAKKQGRTVYAVPGMVGNKNSEASLLLLKNGAKVVTAAEDVINDFEKEYPNLNPHLLRDKPLISLNSALTEYRVSAICQSDGFFEPPRPRRRRAEPPQQATVTAQSTVEAPDVTACIGASDPPVLKSGVGGIDKAAIALYQRIPIDGGCLIEELVDEKTPLREVMKALLKLEVCSMVKMLPGERVIRKSK